ncbi:hypothetical protein EJ04DRAFT_509067 [Polyplosphaeria fusca]|uniref:Transcription factor domain-containing protein n=1 Tax=Polyplosphaeria fusca TaxID=682080 RepID=A0A9P4R8Y2_9PLEO|nr:hypothetical protein EJ04DRAFT_509067 [Polyplosphaeria fusca]
MRQPNTFVRELREVGGSVRVRGSCAGAEHLERVSGGADAEYVWILRGYGMRSGVLIVVVELERLVALKEALTPESSSEGDTPDSAAMGAAELAWVTGSEPERSKSGPYWGPLSVYPALGNLLRARGEIIPATAAHVAGRGLLDALPPVQKGSATFPSPGVCLSIIDTYIWCIKDFYPIVPDYIAKGIGRVDFDEESTPAVLPRNMLLPLLLSVSLRLISKTQPSLKDHADAYFASGVQTNGFEEISIRARLTVLLLACLHNLLSLEQGTIWQQLGLANQLAVENMSEIREGGGAIMYGILVTLEVEVAAAYGRPASKVAQNGALTESDYNGNTLAFHVYLLSLIRRKIHSLVVSTQKNDDTCAKSSSLRGDLSSWIMDWNLAVSGAAPNNPRRSEWLRTIGAALYDQSLLRVLDIPQVEAKHPRERNNVAMRFIQNCHALCFQRQQLESEPPLVFPFFWTHAHAVFGAALVVLKYGENSQDENEALDKAVALLLRLDVEQKLVQTLLALRAAVSGA